MRLTPTRSLLLGGTAAGLLMLALWPQPTEQTPSGAAEPPRRPPSVIHIASSAPVAPSSEPYVANEVMVRVASGVDFRSVARAHGAEVVRAPRRSGYGVLRVPDGMDTMEFQAELAASPGVISATGHGRIRGAGSSCSDSSPNSLVKHQWHLNSINRPSTPISGLTSVVVAVLDTGVAYENHEGYVRAPTLASSAVVAPYDFVNDDAHPNDDHQHGTHIASIIASSGAVNGVAPGVSLMPLKVLDANNSGYEVDLIDALWWAADNGADVVNMSLAFDPGYAPSPALLEAIANANDLGLVLVGAAGNKARRELAWPAASSSVLAVGSYCPKDKDDVRASPFSNLGIGMGIMAPGGCLDADENEDGLRDGIIAETIVAGAPGQTTYMMYAGTSQAAAVTSGAVAWLLAKGADPGTIYQRLQASAEDEWGGDPIEDGYGGGALDLEAALAGVLSSTPYSASRYSVAILPYLVKSGSDSVTPTATLTVLDADGNPASGVRVVGEVHGAGSTTFRCNLATNSAGECVVKGTKTKIAEAPMAWRFTVDAVIEKKSYAVRPSPLFFASDGVEAVLAAMEADPAIAGSALSFYWTDGKDPDLGELAEAYSVMDSGTGLATSPIGLLFTPKAVTQVGTVQSSTMGGGGISTSPLGVRLLTFFNGTGISTSPLGVRLLAIAGTGISTSPLSAHQMLTWTGASTLTGGSSFKGEPVSLGDARIIGASMASGTVLQDVLDAGGMLDDDGYLPALRLAASGVVETEAASTGASGAGAGAEEIEISELSDCDDDSDDDSDSDSD